MNLRSTIAGFVIGCVIAATVLNAQTFTSREGSIFDPEDIPDLGELAVTSGTLTFRTGDSNTLPTVSWGGSTYTGVVGRSESDLVELALFRFKRIVVSNAVNVVVDPAAGNTRGLVLLSRQDIRIDADVRMDGGDGGTSYGSPGGPGAPGAEGGEYGSTFDSAPPNAEAGDGGQFGASVGVLRAGHGFGGGLPGTDPNSTGGGGGYGGNGGGGNGGATYGDAALLDLFGGSGASGSASSWRGSSGGTGGGGGGALALIAERNLTLTGTLSAGGGDGGKDKTDARDGGGGSGGGILLAAETLVLSSNAAVSVQGGDATTSTAHQSNGGGGGGRIAFHYRTCTIGGITRDVPRDQTNAPPVAAWVAGGTASFKPEVYGKPGTFYDGSLPKALRARGTVLAVY